VTLTPNPLYLFACAKKERGLFLFLAFVFRGVRPPAMFFDPSGV